MKALKLLLPLILIGVALFLNGARNVQAVPNQVPSPYVASPTKSPNTQSTPKEEERNAQPIVSAYKQSGTTPTRNKNAAQQHDSAQELALNAALSRYTGQLASYTFWLVIVGAIGVIIAALQAMFLFASIQEHLRPKVTIRSLAMINDLLTRIEDKAPFRFALTLVNHGGTRVKRLALVVRFKG
jgi:hypothetical protein